MELGLPGETRIFRCHCRRRFPLQRETNPLFRAVLSNNLEEFKSLVDAGHCVNIQNNKGSSLLNFVMRRKRTEIFDYLLSLNDIDVNFLDRFEQSPLIYLAGVCFDEYFALKLINKGANIHQTDDSGYTFLHLAAKSESDDNLKVSQLIIEKGADINQQASYGITALYAACEMGNLNWVCMLLYYGADVTIPTDRGVLPLAVISQDIPEEDQMYLQEILFYYTFSLDKINITLSTLVAAMTLNSSLFLKMLDNISDIDYDMQDLRYFVSSLIHVKAYHLRTFFERFTYIVKDLIQNFSVLDVIVKSALDTGLQDLKDILYIFLESSFVNEFVQFSDRNNPIISYLLEIFTNQEFFDLESVTNIICILISYGLNITSSDLDAVYQYCGYCELFKILLHMDILLFNNNDRNSVASLYYNPCLEIETLFNDISHCTVLIDFFNNPKMKACILTNCDDKKVLEKVKQLPHVPLLIELSRNAARKFLIDKFNVKNSVQFYTVLQNLPIGTMNKKIIALEQKLY